MHAHRYYSVIKVPEKSVWGSLGIGSRRPAASAASPPPEPEKQPPPVPVAADAATSAATAPAATAAKEQPRKSSFLQRMSTVKPKD